MCDPNSSTAAKAFHCGGRAGTASERLGKAREFSSSTLCAYSQPLSLNEQSNGRRKQREGTLKVNGLDYGRLSQVSDPNFSSFLAIHIVPKTESKGKILPTLLFTMALIKEVGSLKSVAIVLS